MYLNPTVINKIKQILFVSKEPRMRNVIWAKPEGEVFVFYLFDNGKWVDMSIFENVVIPEISVYLSAFTNDAGFLTEHQSLEAYVNAGSYDSQTKKINLKHDDNTLFSIDASAFIKDGMINNVVVENGNIVITFNTDAGKEPISLPLTEIFNPANYYDKTAIDQLLAGKADKNSLSSVATSGDYNDLSNKPEIPEVPTEVSAFANDAGYLTEHQSLEDYALKSELFSGSYNDLTDKPTIPTVPSDVSAFNNDAGYLTEHQSLEGYATEQWVGEQGYLTEHQDISGKADKQDVQYEDVYLGVGATAESIIVTANHHDVLKKNRPVSFSNATGYIWTILPEDYSPIVKMNGFDIPITLDSTVTISDKGYKVWKSHSSFNGSLSVYLV